MIDRSVKLRLRLVVAFAALLVLASTASAFNGRFMNGDGQFRCQLWDKYHSANGNAFVECVSMATGRVWTMGTYGRVRTYFTDDAIPDKGRRYNMGASAAPILAEPISGLKCIPSRYTVACRATRSSSRPQRWGGWTGDAWGALWSRTNGPARSIIEALEVAPVPPGYVPPVTYNPWPSIIPDFSDPGGTYGEISPLTGLPRTYYVRPYVRRDGTYVGGYYRSCSRCQ